MRRLTQKRLGQLALMKPPKGALLFVVMLVASDSDWNWFPVPMVPISRALGISTAQWLKARGWLEKHELIVQREPPLYCGPGRALLKLLGIVDGGAA